MVASNPRLLPLLLALGSCAYKPVAANEPASSELPNAAVLPPELEVARSLELVIVEPDEGSTCDAFIDDRPRRLPLAKRFVDAWRLVSVSSNVYGEPITEAYAHEQICGDTDCRLTQPAIFQIDSEPAIYALAIPDVDGMRVAELLSVSRAGEGDCYGQMKAELEVIGDVVHVRGYALSQHPNYGYEDSYEDVEMNYCVEEAGEHTDLFVDIPTGEVLLRLTRNIAPGDEAGSVELSDQTVTLRGCTAHDEPRRASST